VCVPCIIEWRVPRTGTPTVIIAGRRVERVEPPAFTRLLPVVGHYDRRSCLPIAERRAPCNRTNYPLELEMVGADGIRKLTYSGTVTV